MKLQPIRLTSTRLGTTAYTKRQHLVARMISVLVLISSTLIAQDISETDRLDPVGIGTNAELASRLFGSDVAVGRDVDRMVLVGSGEESWGYRIDDQASGWAITIATPHGVGSTPATSPVAAFGSDAVFGYSNDVTRGGGAGHGGVWSFEASTLGLLFDGTDAAPRVLAVRPGLIAVGMPQYNGGAGRVRTYRYNSGSSQWIAEAPFDGSFTEGFGTDIAFDQSGNLMVIGVPNAGNNGAVETYGFAGGVWTHLQTLVPPSDFDSQIRADFGASVDIKDGWLAVGAPMTDKIFGGIGIPADDVGAVLLYESVFLGYTFRKRFQDVHSEDYLGTSVALARTASGRYLLAAGVPGDDVGATNTGAVKTFVLDPVTDLWSPGPRLVASAGSQNDELGTAVAADGLRVVAGAPKWNYCPSGRSGLCWSDVGSVYVFDQVGALFVDGFELGSTAAWQ